MSNKSSFKSRIIIWLPTIIAIALVGGIYFGLNIAGSQQQSTIIISDNMQNEMGQGSIEEIIRYIESKYVTKVDRSKLVKSAITNVLDQLDPHSSYISSDELESVNEQLQGDFDGIGIEFMILNDTIFVLRPLKGGPSEKVGIKKGDRIVAIEDSIVAGTHIDIKQTIAYLKGIAGTEVNIKVFRKGVPDLLSFTITRNTIPDYSVEIGYMIDEETAYFKINKFSATTYKEFMKIIEDLSMNDGMKNIIIDLRQNPGGYLQEATKILNQFFIEKDKLLVYTEGHSVRRSEYRTTGKSFFDFNDICILIDEGSASASEILAGSLQDLDRGIIIGRRSFGKGLVQEQYNLSDGSALRLTVAKYFIPSGRCIQRNYETGHKKYDHDYIDRINSGEFLDSTKMSIGDTTKYFTLKGREVHGGGGITPDYFVPLDTIYSNDFVVQIGTYIREFAFYYADNHPSEFTSSKKFINNFQLSEKDFNEFLQLIRKNNIDVPIIIEPNIRKFIQNRIKAFIGRYAFDDETYFQIHLQHDSDFQKAMQIINGRHQLVEKVN